MHAPPAVGLVLALLLATTPALAAVHLVGRESKLSGQYLIGAGAQGESGGGSDSETSTEDRPALQIDATGQTSGITAGTPWTAMATFSAGHQFLRDETGGVLGRLTGSGSTQTFAEATAPALAFAGVAASGNWLTLAFDVDAPTPYTLQAQVSASGTTAQDISASVQLQRASGSRWAAVQIVSTALGDGSAWRDGVLDPGLYRISAQAGAESFHTGPVTSAASWNFDLVFAPVPEPATPALMLAGLALLVRRRRQRLDRRLVGATIALGLSVAAAPSFALVTYGSPHQYEVAAVGGTPWSFFDGVAHLEMIDAQGEVSDCSGAVLWTGGHVLTAAHCLYDTYFGIEAVSARIHLPALEVSVALPVDRSLAHHRWTGNVGQGYDLAVIPLGIQVAAGYQIDRQGYGMFNLGTDDPPYLLMAGYGLSGSGALDGTLYPAGTLRAGFNQYDALWTDVPRAPYKFDFDDYTAAHNATGRNGTGFIPGYGEHWVEVDWDFSGDPVRGEAMIAPGDSGGPSFLDSILVGIHSFINTSAADADAVINASFGEVAADTRVFMYADWIDARVAGAVPEPGAEWLMLAGMAGLLVHRRRSASI